MRHRRWPVRTTVTFTFGLISLVKAWTHLLFTLLNSTATAFLQEWLRHWETETLFLVAEFKCCRVWSRVIPNNNRLDWILFTGNNKIQVSLIYLKMDVLLKIFRRVIIYNELYIYIYIYILFVRYILLCYWWLVYVMAYQLLIGYLMSKFISFENIDLYS